MGIDPGLTRCGVGVISQRSAKELSLQDVGVILTPLGPELGLPRTTLSTRFLKEKYSWAERINSWAEAKLKSARNWFRKRRNN